MFSGEYEPTLDNKGRFIVPIEYREQLGMKFRLLKGLDDCLYIYSEDEWQKVADKIQKLPDLRKDIRAFKRSFFRNVNTVSVDSQGRITIPIRLREKAKIKKNIVLMGINNRIEIWSKEELDLNSEEEEDMGAIAEGIGEEFDISF